jgi:hypothetical protein
MSQVSGLLGLEVACLLKICNQSGTGRAPSQPFLRLRAGSRTVSAYKVPEKAKMVGCLLPGLADDRDVQAPADCVSDVSELQPLFGDCVIPGSRRCLLKRQPVDAGSVEEVRSGPAVEPVTHKRRDTLLASDIDQVGDQALLDSVVDLREAHHHRRALPAKRATWPSLPTRGDMRRR